MYQTEKVDGRKLKTLRTMMAFNQGEIADRIGICLSAYQLKENGQNDFKASEIRKLSKIFGIAMEELYREETNSDHEEEAYAYQ